MGSHRHVLEAAAAAHQRGERAALAIVVDAEGSTYVRPGAMALFGVSTGQVGWLSGGCLEPEIEARACAAVVQSRIEWMDIDTRDDEDLIAGSALGCRGRLHLALLPLAALSGWPALVDAWMHKRGALRLSLSGQGDLQATVGELGQAWRVASAPMQGPGLPEAAWTIEIPPPPALVVFGAGPETPTLLPLLRSLGWRVTLVERRERWLAHAQYADAGLATPAGSALVQPGTAFDAALAMNHNFELDREALLALAASQVPFVGLLGPVRRREDLFRVLPPTAREALLPRLHSPVGLKLGGQGPEAIALSIAAQLQVHRFPQ
ncbi:MAG: XdhC/CoxI family protein [Lysobacteraceae bacterium]|nr:MAG: XdhC/CoxI family protein [Xanthomonadaceae bacterium]